MMIPISRPTLGPEEEQAVLEVLRSGKLAQGERVREFESRFATDIGSRHGIATSSGTTALHLAALALGIGAGDEVILPPITFIASAAAILFCGGRPVFSDVEEDTYNLDPLKIKGAITGKTKAIMPVHMYGQGSDMEAIREVAQDHDLSILEDACQSHGASVKGKKLGTWGSLACFSFYPTKNMTTGEGGMILTDEAELADRCRLLRAHGAPEPYRHERLGYNYRMTELAAAIGIEQLKKLGGFIRKRQEHARRLDESLGGTSGIVGPRTRPDRDHVFYQYVVRVEPTAQTNREGLIKAFQGMGVGARACYPMPLYAQPALRKLGINGDCPIAEWVIPKMFELPVYPSLRPEEMEMVCRAVRSLA